MAAPLQIGKREHLRMILRALRYVWQGGRGWTLGTCVLLFVQGLLPLVSLYLLKVFLDRLSLVLAHQEAARAVVLVVILLAAVGVLEGLCRTAASLLEEGQTQAVTDHMQATLHAKSVAVDLAYYESPSYYDTFYRAQAEGGYRPTQIARALGQLLQNGLSLAGVAVLIVSFDVRVALLLCAAAVPGLLVKVFYADRLNRLYRERTPSERRARYLDLLLGGERHAKEVRLYGLGPELMRRFAELRRMMRRERMSLATRALAADFATHFFAVLAIYGSLAFALGLTLAGRLTLGGLVMYYQAFQRGQLFLSSVVRALASLYEANLYLAGLHEFLRVEARVLDPPNPLPVPCPWQTGLRCEQVGFRYDGQERPALVDVSLELGPGQVLALVGENGSGKTTLVKLLCRLYDPTSGRITLDGQPLQSYAQADLRRSITVVFQDYVNYRLTARENVGFGNLARMGDQDALDRAARLGGADRVLAGLPRGWDTELGRWFDEGHELSEGQWQKMALARAFFRDAQLIVLDEPTSALDPRAEAEFFARFREVLGTRCAVLISHRFSTVRMADRIAVFDQGRVLEQGSHEELMAAAGPYAALFSLQARAYR